MTTLSDMGYNHAVLEGGVLTAVLLTPGHKYPMSHVRPVGHLTWPQFITQVADSQQHYSHIYGYVEACEACAMEKTIGMFSNTAD